MALNTQLANATVSAQAETLNTLCAGGTITIYNGTQPANADTAITTQTAGLILTMGSPAFTVSNDTMTATAIADGTAIASITPTWARIRTSGGATVMDISAGASGANITISAFTTGQIVKCTGFTHTIRKSTTGF